MTQHSPIEVVRPDDTGRELTDTELEEVAAGKAVPAPGGSVASRGWFGAGYGHSRGYDGYGVEVGR